MSSEGYTPSGSMPRRYDFNEVKQKIRERGSPCVRSLLVALQIKFRVHGDWCFVEGYPAKGSGSFCVFSNGTFKDFNGGEQGDMLDLCQMVRRDTPGQALHWIYGELGLVPRTVSKRLSHEELLAREKAFREECEAAQAREDAKRTRKEERCHGRYLMLPGGEGTIVQTYLEASRAIDFGPEGVGRFSDLLRFEDDARYYHDKDNFELLPAMVAPFLRAGKVCGLHRTFLRPDGLAKAYPGVDAKGKALPAKKMFGTKGIIPIHKGEGNLSAGKAIERGWRGVLAVCEGIEDGFTVAMYQPSYRVWAAGDKGNMARIAWPEIASAVVLIADNDGDTEEEQAANFARVEKHWRDQANGRPLKIARSLSGKDFNDWHNQ